MTESKHMQPASGYLFLALPDRRVFKRHTTTKGR